MYAMYRTCCHLLASREGGPEASCLAFHQLFSELTSSIVLLVARECCHHSLTHSYTLLSLFLVDCHIYELLLAALYCNCICGGATKFLEEWGLYAWGVKLTRYCVFYLIECVCNHLYACVLSLTCVYVHVCA